MRSIIHKIHPKRLLLNNWRSKLLCLLCAVIVWLMVNHLLVRGDGAEWDIDDIRVVTPE